MSWSAECHVLLKITTDWQKKYSSVVTTAFSPGIRSVPNLASNSSTSAIWISNLAWTGTPDTFCSRRNVDGEDTRHCVLTEILFDSFDIFEFDIFISTRKVTIGCKHFTNLNNYKFFVFVILIYLPIIKQESCRSFLLIIFWTIKFCTHFLYFMFY